MRRSKAISLKTKFCSCLALSSKTLRRSTRRKSPRKTFRLPTRRGKSGPKLSKKQKKLLLLLQLRRPPRKPLQQLLLKGVQKALKQKNSDSIILSKTKFESAIQAQEKVFSLRVNSAAQGQCQPAFFDSLPNWNTADIQISNVGAPEIEDVVSFFVQEATLS